MSYKEAKAIIRIEIEKRGGFPPVGKNLPRGFRAEMAEKTGLSEDIVAGIIRCIRREDGIPPRRQHYEKREPKAEDKKDLVWAIKWGCYRATPSVEKNAMRKMAALAEKLLPGGVSAMYGTWTHAAFSTKKPYSGHVFRDNYVTARAILRTSDETHNYTGSLKGRPRALAKKRGWKKVLPAIIGKVGVANPKHFEKYVYELAKCEGLVKVWLAMSGEWKGYKDPALRLVRQFPKLYIKVK
jgi:hypothetical protein